LTALYIVLAVLLFILLLLLCPLSVKIEIGEQYKAYVGYLFIKYDLLKERDKQKKQKKQEKPQKEKPKPESVTKTLKSFSELLDIFAKDAAKLLKKLVLNRLKLTLGVGGEDAAVTALEFGAINAAVYPLVGLISSQIKIKKTDINIYPRYNLEWEIYLNIKISILPIFVLSYLNKVILRIISKKVKEGAQK